MLELVRIVGDAVGVIVAVSLVLVAFVAVLAVLVPLMIMALLPMLMGMLVGLGFFFAYEGDGVDDAVLLGDGVEAGVVGAAVGDEGAGFADAGKVLGGRLEVVGVDVGAVDHGFEVAER